jgi:ubiquinone/menaquinone biosynthesis C-methylase UbiE
MTSTEHRFHDGAAYEVFMGPWSQAAGAVFLQWLTPPPDARWLDVGCGTGIFTKLISDTCAPAEVFAVDPEDAQIDYARRQFSLARTNFRIADGCALPFPDSMFDIAVSALVMNFISDRPRALSEMRRVVRAGGMVGAYVWDFTAEASPSWPLRRALHEGGIQVPSIPGADSSNLDALRSLFAHGGLVHIETRSIEVSVQFPDFQAFWLAQTPSYSPTTKMINRLSSVDRERLVEALRAQLPLDQCGQIQYYARANAIKGNIPN